MSLVTDRQRVLHWARKLVQEGHWVTFDTETTGLGEEDEIIQWAVCDSDGTVLGQSYIKPTVPVSDGARDIHGIGDELLADAPTFDQVWPTLWSLIEGKLVVIYNESFDRRMLYQSAYAYRLNLPDFTSVCAMHQYAAFHGETHHYYGGYTWQRLETACRRFGIENDDAHNAVTDAKATALIVQALAAQAHLELPKGFKLPVDVPCAGGCKNIVKECMEPDEVWYCQGCGLKLGLYHRCPKCQHRIIETSDVEQWCGWCVSQKEKEDKLASGEWHRCRCQQIIRVPVATQEYCDFCTTTLAAQAAEQARRVAARKAAKAAYQRVYRQRRKLAHASTSAKGDPS
jgi:DNA polymerase-3 subunit epsilon